MSQNYKPMRDPRARVCKFCGATGATRWDGGIGGMVCAGSRLQPIVAPQYCCEACDPRHKWFDLDESDFA